MPKQIGFLKVEGTLGDVSFYKTKGGYLLRPKNQVSAEKIATDPAYQRTRENNAEFSLAAKASKLLRTALRLQMQEAKDGRVVSRLTTLMLRIAKTDPVSKRGERNVTDGELALLNGFNFNISSDLDNTLKTEYSPVIDRVGGKLSVTIASFTPAKQLLAPAGATHFKVISAGVELDFKNGTMVTASSESALLPLDNIEVTVPDLVNALPANSPNPLFLALGIVFGQQVNGVEYPLKDKTFNALKLVAINSP